MLRNAYVFVLLLAACGSPNHDQGGAAGGSTSSGGEGAATRPRIAITTEPPGARVFVDEVDRGAAPIELPVDPRQHRFAIVAQGQRRFEGEWNAIATELYSVYAVYATAGPRERSGESTRSTTDAVLAHREELARCGLDGPQALHKVTIERNREGVPQMVVVQAYLPLEKVRCIAQHAIAWPFFGSGFPVSDTFLGPANENHSDEQGAGD